MATFSHKNQTKNMHIQGRFVLAGTLIICCLALSNARSVKAQQQAPGRTFDPYHIMKPLNNGIPNNPEDISPLLDGEKIPIIDLPDVSGKPVDLNQAVESKPTILVFYRGGWCPYCSKQLAGLQEALPDLRKMGYQLIAIGTDDPAHLSVTAGKEKLDYTLLSDADLAVSKRFGLAYKAPASYDRILPQASGGKNRDKLLPVPSVFILDRKGIIQFEYINPDFTQRLRPDLLKAAAKALYKYL